MARSGQFSGPSVPFGQTVGIVHPVDNNVLASKYHQILTDASLNLTEEQREELQREIDELLALLKASRDYSF